MDSNFAYLLGLFYSDGSINGNTTHGYTSKIKLSAKDRDILEQLQGVFPHYTYIPEREEKLYDGRPTKKSLLISYKKEEYLKLKKYGLVEAKSTRNADLLDMPLDIENYMPDFIRGLYDGDGSMALMNTGSHSADINLSMGNKKVINGLKRFYDDNNIEYTEDDRRDTKGYIALRIRQKDSIRKWYNLIYYSNDIINLQRKRSNLELFLIECDILEESKIVLKIQRELKKAIKKSKKEIEPMILSIDKSGKCKLHANRYYAEKYIKEVLDVKSKDIAYKIKKAINTNKIIFEHEWETLAHHKNSVKRGNS